MTKLEYEDRGDGYYRCVDCEMAFRPEVASAAQDATNCCPHEKYARYCRTWRGQLSLAFAWLSRTMKRRRKQ